MKLTDPVTLPTADVLIDGAGARLGQWCWAVFDGARSPYNVLVNIFVFSAYFTTVVVPDAVQGQVLWSYANSFGALLIAVGAPILGAIADAGGRRKPWLLGCLCIGFPSMLILWTATPAMGQGLGWVLAAIVGGVVFYEYTATFGNAMLPSISPPQRIGFLSGMGYALGNFFGVVLFVFFLFAWSWNEHPLFGLNVAAHEPERAVGILTAIWVVVFSAPMFLFTPDTVGMNLGLKVTVVQGLRRLGHTVARIRDYRNVGLFLIARMIFNEGFVVLMLYSGIYAAGVLHWTATMLIVQGLINSVAAALAGGVAGWLDTRIGSRRSVMVFVAGALLANFLACSISPDSVLFMHVLAQGVPTALFPTVPDKVFSAAQVAAAIFVTGGLASSRAMMAKLSPPSMLTEFFGIYSMSGTATSFLGPLAIGLLTSLFHSQRAGFGSGIAFLACGLLLFFSVKEASPGLSP
jgi:UMF1 family MFS transporter